MPLGTIVIAAAVAVIGSLLSFVYLKINQVCPSAYLCILIAFGFGAALGYVAYMLIKILKIRSVASAVVGTIIGCILFTLFKWALYVQFDYEKYQYKAMADQSAAEYLGIGMDFTDDDDNMITSEEEAAECIALMKSISMEDYINFHGYTVNQYVDYHNENFYDSVTAADIKGKSYFEFYYPEEYFDEDRALECVNAAMTMDLYEYTYEFIGEKEPVTVSYLFAHPGEWWQAIKDINEVGRWSITSSHASQTTRENARAESGIILWIVWIGEFFCINVPAIVIAAARAGKPFIESEKKWAILTKSDGLSLVAPTFIAGVANSVKANPDILLTYEPFVVGGKVPRINIEIYHSSDYTENYITVNYRTFNNKGQAQNKVLVKYVKASIAFVAKLYKHCNQDIPFSTAGLGLESESMETASAAQTAKANQYGTYNQSMTAPMGGGMESVSMPQNSFNRSTATPAEGLADEKSQKDVFDELNS